jgi:uncharacterized protein YxjI
MNKLFLVLAAVTLPIILAACMGAKYKITTHTGETYISTENPQYNVEADTYVFQDEKGKEIMLKKQEIQFIKEQ